MATSNEQVAKVIAKGLELLGPKGENWVVGSLTGNDGQSYCMLGALEEAGSELKLQDNVVNKAKIAVAAAIPGSDTRRWYAEDDIPTFNDGLPGRYYHHSRERFNNPASKKQHAESFKKVKRVMCKALKSQLTPAKKKTTKTKAKKHTKRGK